MRKFILYLLLIPLLTFPQIKYIELEFRSIEELVAFIKTLEDINVVIVNSKVLEITRQSVKQESIYVYAKIRNVRHIFDILRLLGLEYAYDRETNTYFLYNTAYKGNFAYCFINATDKVISKELEGVLSSFGTLFYANGCVAGLVDEEKRQALLTFLSLVDKGYSYVITDTPVPEEIKEIANVYVFNVAGRTIVFGYENDLSVVYDLLNATKDLRLFKIKTELELEPLLEMLNVRFAKLEDEYVLYTYPEVYRSILNLISKQERKYKVSLKIYSMSKTQSKNLNFGIDLNVITKELGLRIVAEGINQLFLEGDKGSIRLFFDYLSQFSETSLLLSQDFIVTEGKEYVYEDTLTLPFLTSIQRRENIDIPTFEYKDVGMKVKLKVKDNRLFIELENAELVSEITQDVFTIPVIRKSLLKTEFPFKFFTEYVLIASSRIRVTSLKETGILLYNRQKDREKITYVIAVYVEKYNE